MVEFVIVAPVRFMIFFALVEFGVLFGRWQTITNAAREGARTAVVWRQDCNASAVTTEVKTRVKLYTAPLGLALTDAQIAVSGVCGSSDTSSTVNIVYPHEFKVLPNLAKSVSPTINLIGNSVMRNEGTG